MRYDVKLTGKDPVHPHVLSVCVTGKGYYYNKQTGKVSTYKKSGSEFIIVSIKDKELIKSIKDALENV